MKNIHIIVTDKPSRLQLNVNTKKLILFDNIQSNNESVHLTTQNIYITSDEEIKEGEYSLYLPFGVGKNIVIDGELCFHIEAKDGKGSFTQRTYQTLDRNKKIILTTDQDLDGVQAIDDDFLEWFVKNPSCEEIETMFACRGFNGIIPNLISIGEYKIIIPKEELNLNCFDCNKSLQDCTCMEDTIDMKQESIEEAAEKCFNYIDHRNTFIAGAKWQQEKMYSEEEVIELLTKRCEHFGTSVSPFYKILLKQDLEWFNEFKKR